MGYIRGAERLAQCDPHLRTLIQCSVEALPECIGIVVACGHRGKVEQDKAFKSGRSNVPWPKGKHNSMPSLAVDVYPIVNGNACFDAESCYMLAGFIRGVAAMTRQIHKFTFGADWDGDLGVKDQKLHDIGHIEMA